jgi:hypothetical protein
MRRVVPHAFLLFAGPLDEAHEQRRTEAALEVLRSVQPDARGPDVAGVPVALRWVTIPFVGFPRTRFEVWRRARSQKPGTRLFDEDVVVGGTTLTPGWSVGEMYDVHFTATPDPGSTLEVAALDTHGHVIPGQRIGFAAAARGAFRSPGIAALRLSGNGTVGNVLGTEQNDFANQSGWERVQLVGLPFKTGEVGSPVYDPAPQGYEAASLDGLDAAHLRLEIARVMRMPLPPTGVPDIPTPAWEAPDPAAFLDRLRNTTPALVRLIESCLNQSDDTDLARLQVRFETDEVLPGIRQADLPGASPGADPTVMRLPVVGISMLAAGADGDAATALGYGTIDFAERRPLEEERLVVPPGTVRTSYDYMVTAPYVFPFIGTIELAALAQARPVPEPAVGLQTARRQGNRAPAPDQAVSESISVSWQLSQLPQGYGILVSRSPGSSAILNPPRGGDAYDPFIPLRPQSVDGAPPVTARTSFTDPASPVPLAGSALSRYMIIGLDPFGRWSPWRGVSHTSTAPPVQVPGLLSAALQTNVAGRTGSLVPASLEVELAWDWSDRSPDRIELAGAFVTPGAEPPSTPAGSVPFGPGGPVVLRFGTAGAPFIASGHAGTVSEIQQNPPDAERRRYRLTLTGVTCDYTSASEVAFAVWARGAELVRPAVLSAAAGPSVAKAPNPIPPDPPSLPAIDLLWTALPDATGRARAVLRWPAVPGAVGYMVWEATEVPLRQAVNPSAAPPPAATVLARAGALRVLVTASAQSQARSLVAFSRLNERPLAATQLELALPGSADTLYAYRVSAITASTVESPRSSTVALVAVPRRIVPGRPRLLLRAVSGGVDVIVLPGKGQPAAGYRVHRVRRDGLAADVGTMGPPVLDETATGWRNVSVPRRPRGSDADPGRAITDPVPESWYPYHYRVVALGAADPPNGGLPGESEASAMASIVRPPTAPPVLDSIAATGNATNRVVSFRTNLPIRRSPVGTAEIAVVRLAAPAAGERLERAPVLVVVPDEVEQDAALTPLASPTAAQLAAMPEISRGAPDAQGRCTYTVRMRAEVKQGFVVVRDPLSRTVELAIPEAP